MTTINQSLLNIIMVLLSWLTLPLLGTRKIKKYLPATILVILIHSITTLIGKRRKWWVFYNKPNSYLTGEFPFLIGPFLVISMWILKWTYRNFASFLMVNALAGAFFAFPLATLMKKWKVYTLVRISKFQFFLYFFVKCSLLYGFHYYYEKNKDRIDKFVMERLVKKIKYYGM